MGISTLLIAAEVVEERYLSAAAEAAAVTGVFDRGAVAAGGATSSTTAVEGAPQRLPAPRGLISVEIEPAAASVDGGIAGVAGDDETASCCATDGADDGRGIVAAGLATGAFQW